MRGPHSTSQTHTYHITKRLGTGGCSIVFQATEAHSGHQVALKKSRASQKLKRPLLQYESRVLQLLQGHPAIPALFGYGHLPHFEYLSLELLGPSIDECAAEGPVCVETTARVVLQTVSALEHVHQHGFVHRDIKPENILCSRTHPARIVLIDFGISGRITLGAAEPSRPRYDPVAEKKHIVGTLYWASLNSHNGIDLSPRDDLESLAYTAFFLLDGDLPWSDHDSDVYYESTLSRMRRIHIAKAAQSGDTLGAPGHPSAFGYLLDSSRLLGYNGQLPDYEGLRGRFADLLQRDVDPERPFDWRPVGTSKVYPHAHAKGSSSPDADADADVDANANASDSDGEGDSEEEEESFTNSYFAYDIDQWDHCQRGNRDRGMTLPAEQAELLELEEGNCILRIVEVTSEKNV